MPTAEAEAPQNTRDYRSTQEIAAKHAPAVHDGDYNAAPQLAGPVAGPVRIAPQFESFYTAPIISGSIT